MSELADLVEAILKAMDRSQRRVVVLDAITQDDEETAYIVKVLAAAKAEREDRDV